MESNTSKVWNSVELFNMYKCLGGLLVHKKHVVKSILDYFGENVLIMSSPGFANVILFRVEAKTIMKLVDDNDDDIDSAVEKVAKYITEEVKSAERKHTHYNTTINIDLAREGISDTFMKLLASISKSLENTFPALMIGSIITSTLLNIPTNLQIALGVLMRHDKSLIQELYKYRICCTYDETLRFKKSAAFATCKNAGNTGISKDNTGLVQFI